MPLVSNYQKGVLTSLADYDFIRVLRMKGSCHDALIGELANWWFSRDIVSMICNPARSSKAGSRRYIADLLFLELPEDSDYYEVKGVAEVENNERKFMDKLKSLMSYENYVKQGLKAYPDLEFAILCYTLNIPNDELAHKIYSKIFEISQDSSLLWIACEIDIDNSLRDENKKEADYSIHMPNYVKGYDYFFYYRNFSSVILYGIKNGEQVGEIIIPNVEK